MNKKKTIQISQNQEKQESNKNYCLNHFLQLTGFWPPGNLVIG